MNEEIITTLMNNKSINYPNEQQINKLIDDNQILVLMIIK